MFGREKMVFNQAVFLSTDSSVNQHLESLVIMVPLPYICNIFSIFYQVRMQLTVNFV